MNKKFCPMILSINVSISLDLSANEMNPPLSKRAWEFLENLLPLWSGFQVCNFIWGLREDLVFAIETTTRYKVYQGKLQSKVFEEISRQNRNWLCFREYRTDLYLPYALILSCRFFECPYKVKRTFWVMYKFYCLNVQGSRLLVLDKYIILLQRRKTTRNSRLVK